MSSWCFLNHHDQDEYVVLPLLERYLREDSLHCVRTIKLVEFDHTPSDVEFNRRETWPPFATTPADIVAAGSTDHLPSLAALYYDWEERWDRTERDTAAWCCFMAWRHELVERSRLHVAESKAATDAASWVARETPMGEALQQHAKVSERVTNVSLPPPNPASHLTASPRCRSLPLALAHSPFRHR